MWAGGEKGSRQAGRPGAAPAAHLRLAARVGAAGEVQAHGLGDVQLRLQLLDHRDGLVLGLGERKAAELGAGAGHHAAHERARLDLGSRGGGGRVLVWASAGGRGHGVQRGGRAAAPGPPRRIPAPGAAAAAHRATALPPRAAARLTGNLSRSSGSASMSFSLWVGTLTNITFSSHVSRRLPSPAGAGRGRRGSSRHVARARWAGLRRAVARWGGLQVQGGTGSQQGPHSPLQPGRRPSAAHRRSPRCAPAPQNPAPAAARRAPRRPQSAAPPASARARRSGRAASMEPRAAPAGA
jgi:hypothetical protein